MTMMFYCSEICVDANVQFWKWLLWPKWYWNFWSLISFDVHIRSMPLKLPFAMITTLELLKMVLVAPMRLHMDSLIKVKSLLGGSLLKILH
jgi:hypothetical protein